MSRKGNYQKNIFEEKKNDDVITNKQWFHRNKETTIYTFSPTKGFISHPCEILIREHHYILSRKPPSLYSRRYSKGKASYCSLRLDAVQGHSWNNTQATLHPAIICYRAIEKLNLEHMYNFFFLFFY